MRTLKRYSIVLVILAGVLFSAGPALAVDVKFSGFYKFEGWSESNRSLGDDANTAAAAKKAPSTSFMNSTLQLDTQFKVAEGLTLTTRARILDKIWGDQGTRDRTVVVADASTVAATVTSRSKFLRENIEFERLYVTFNALYGFFDVGFQRTTMTGTDFGNTDDTQPIIKYTYRTGPWTGYVLYQKTNEKEVNLYGSAFGGTPVFSDQSDSDRTEIKYGLAYAAPTWDAGFGNTYYIDKSTRTNTSSSYDAKYHKLDPYVRATIGPVYLEAEMQYLFGDYRNYEESGNINSTRSGWAWYGKGLYNAGPVYVGAQYAYVGGDDPATADKYEAGASSGREYKPCLILLNSDRDKWLGALGNGNVTAMNDNYTSQGSVNFTLYQVFAGFKPVSKLDLYASFSYAKLNEKPLVGGLRYVDDKIGNELDLTATYKIYDNLSYMVGFGYLWAGDAWKGTDAAKAVGNDWLLMHRLTLNF